MKNLALMALFSLMLFSCNQHYNCDCTDIYSDTYRRDIDKGTYTKKRAERKCSAIENAHETYTLCRVVIDK